MLASESGVHLIEDAHRHRGPPPPFHESKYVAKLRAMTFVMAKCSSVRTMAGGDAASRFATPTICRGDVFSSWALVLVNPARRTVRTRVLRWPPPDAYQYRHPFHRSSPHHARWPRRRRPVRHLDPHVRGRRVRLRRARAPEDRLALR